MSSGVAVTTRQVIELSGKLIVSDGLVTCLGTSNKMTEVTICLTCKDEVRSAVLVVEAVLELSAWLRRRVARVGVILSCISLNDTINPARQRIASDARQIPNNTRSQQRTHHVMQIVAITALIDSLSVGHSTGC